MITGMTIARDFTSGSASHGAEPERGASAIEFDAHEAVPFELRAERLARQVQSFERAGYRLETHAALQAVVVKPRSSRQWRTALLIVGTAGLYLVPLLLGAGRTYHRVAITVDRSGAVRLS
jgi:hypothetical protein